MKYYNIFLSIVAAAAMTACSDEADVPVMPDTSEGITINVECTDMLPEALLSRAGEDLGPAKTAEEKRINRLHLFFFDKESGEFLDMVNQDQDGENLFRPYHVVDVADGQQAAVTIPKDAFVDQANLTNIIIYAVANVTCQDKNCDHKSSYFRTTFTPDGHICHGAKDNANTEVTVDNLEVLRNWYYRPAIREDITKLPEGGMPMVGEFDSEGKAILSGNQRIEIKMKALMARVDVNVKLDANQTSHDHQLPSLRITSYGVNNMPTCVPFTELAADAETVLMDPEHDMRKEALVEIPEEQRRTLLDGQEAATFSYYTYENVRKPLPDSEWNGYPAGVKETEEEVSQRWKPSRAQKDVASSFVMYGDYVTHQGLHYKAGFRVYLGSDVVSKFDVYRNRCYINNISIRGLDYVRNDDDTRYTFDGRVNVKTDNPVYISIVNERKLDAHWNVVPMDVYLLRREAGETDLESYVDISIDPAAQSWLKMEKVDSIHMYDGMDGVDNADLYISRPAQKYINGEMHRQPGNGARKYFTTDLLGDNNLKTSLRISGPVDKSRTRIYFYVDENVSTQDRTATITVVYNNKNNDRRERTLEFDQRGLLLVNGTSSSTTPFYIEYYEEYIDHRDPLDQHEQDNAYYDGLPWARENAWLATNAVIGREDYTVLPVYTWRPFNPCNVYDNGLQMTNYIFNNLSANVAPMTEMMTYPENIPASAIHYCYAKNKRNADGTVSNADWYMPGIRELESAITTYYSTFNEFQDNYYWSSATAKAPDQGGREYENATYARATKYRRPDAGTDQRPYVESGSKNDDDLYTGLGNKDKGGNHGAYHSGKAPKTRVFRVRACRRANGVSN